MFRLFSNGRPRTGMTLLELLLAISIMVIVVGALGGLAKAVQLSSAYSEGHGSATQHARVALERIARTVNEAIANESFPGFIVLAEEEGIWRFPDTLAVWNPDEQVLQTHPERLPLDDPSRQPYYDELVIFCPHPTEPNLLLEVIPGDARGVPPIENEAAWASDIAVIKTSPASRRVTLTNLLRTCSVTGVDASVQRGAVRFEARLRPSASQWQAYQDGSITWETLPWVQGIYASTTGLRQAWLRTELQLMPGQQTAADDPGGQQVVPFLGSAAVYYRLEREEP